jgi:ParB family chromosome partitioning protein
MAGAGSKSIEPIDAVRKAHQSGTEPHLMGADALSKALDFDMMLWWGPTAENYFKRIKRDQILAAISEATGKPAPERLLKLKKGDLAAEAEALLENIVWVPPLLRG